MMVRLFAKALSARTAGAAVIAFIAFAGSASAQGVCDSGRGIFETRAKIIGQINGWSKKKVEPGLACSTFGKLQANGTQALSFMRTNKDWCHIPDDAIKSLEQQQGAVEKNRAQACKVAADYNKARKQAQQQAKQAQQQGAGAGFNAFAGPDDLSGGPRALPKGAL